MKLKLLYLSCHETLERDELTIFNKLGFDVFPIGHYTDQDNPIKATNGKLPFRFSDEWLPIFNKYHSYDKLRAKLSNIVCGGSNPYMFKLHKEFVKLFDIIIVGYYEENITINWDAIKDKRIVLRTISQYPLHVSEHRDKIKIVSLAENEECLLKRKPDAVVRQCVDTNYYKGWSPSTDYLLTVNKWLKKRGDTSCWKVYDYVSQGFNRIACGFGNEDIPWGISDLPQDKIQEFRQKSRVYISMCSKPGCVTYGFIEALSTGIPVVSVGPNLGSWHPSVKTFNVDRFIQNGVNGFYSDNPDEMVHYIKLLMNDASLAKRVGDAGRETAIQYFSEDKCISDWRNFFKEHVL